MKEHSQQMRMSTSTSQMASEMTCLPVFGTILLMFVKLSWTKDTYMLT
jgi:hypothetical protein